MRQPGRTLRFYLLLLLVVVGTGCTLLGVGQKKQHTTAERIRAQEAKADKDPDQRAETIDYDEPEDWEDEEAGIKAISGNLRRFREALDSKDFHNATKFLRRAQKLTRQADDVTKGHPEFEEIESRVLVSLNRLEVAIERDRIERRNAAIDDLIARGEGAVAEANRLYAELAQRVPTEQDVQKLDELLTTLAGLRGDGADYLDEKRYVTHADDRDAKSKVIENLRQDAQWQLNAMSAVSKNIERAYQAAVGARRTNDVDAQIEGFHQSSLAFRDCATTIAELEGDKRYNAGKLIQTRLGALSLEDTRRKCLELAAQGRAQVGTLSFQRKVDQVVSVVNTAISRMKNPKSPEDELQRTREAADTLAKCMLELERIESAEGYNKSTTFRSLLGEHTAVSLAKSCAKERERIIKELPTIEWRTTLTGIKNRLEAIQSFTKEALAASSPTEARSRWEQTVGALKECQAQANSLSRRRGAVKSMVINTAYGKLTIGEVEKLCAKKRAEAEDALKKAITQKERDDFAKTVIGDEQDVVKREGIPTRIENFAGGRIFIYESQGPKGSKELRRFGFDRSGKRVDYWVEWRNQVVGVVSELVRVMGLYNKAPSAGAKLAAVDAAQPVLEVCHEILKAGKKSPGYDAKAFFRTPLGKLTVDKLIDACAAEKDRMVAEINTLKWRERVEALRDRIDESQQQLDEAKKLTKPDEQLSLLSKALGGLQECIERAAALPKEPGQDTKFKVNSSQGRIDIYGIQKACAAMKTETEKAVDGALEAQALLKFIASCRGDEIEVARREGMPQQVEQLTGGRIFVYISKSARKKEVRRVAFDPTGKRVSEKLLAAQAKGDAKVFEVKNGELTPVK